MNLKFKAVAVILPAGVITGSMTGCSKDLSTGPADGPAARVVESSASSQSPPANDGFGRALLIDRPLPFVHKVNTSQARTAEDDPVGDDDCGFDSVDGHTVWYRFRSARNIRVNFSTVGSDFDPNMFVYTGRRGDLTRVTCNFLPASMTLDALAETTYFILVGSSDAEPGGNLVLNVDRGLVVTVRINGEGRVNPETGVATIRGRVTCSRPSFYELGGSVQQRRGDVLITGSLSQTSFECDGVTPWRAEAFPDEGRFVAGRVEVSAGALFTANATTEERNARAEDATVQLIR
jgi:hypothetical protein